MVQAVAATVLMLVITDATFEFTGVPVTFPVEMPD
jgi:hypothetical protein